MDQHPVLAVRAWEGRGVPSPREGFRNEAIPSPDRRRSGTRSAARTVILALIAAAGAFGGALAKNKNADWPEITAAEKAITSVPGDPAAPAVILRHTRDGKMVMRGRWMTNVLDYHWRLKVLNDRGKDFSAVEIPANKWSRVDDVRARTVKADGTIVPVREDQIFEKVVTKARGVRETEFVFNFPAVEPGAILEYAYERETTSLVFVEPWFFSGEAYTVLSRVSQAVPTEAHYQILCERCPNPDPDRADWKEGKVRGKLLTVEMHDVPADHREIMMPPQREILPRFEMILRGWTYTHWDALGRDDALFADWDSVARYFSYYYRGAYMLDEVAVTQVVSGWTAGIDDPEGRVRAVFRHVQADFRYEEASYVIARTRTIAEILKARSADNEEKAVLLVAALRALKLEPMIALVAGLDKGPLYANYFSFVQFSHAVVALPRPDGSLRWMDPTATWTPYGVLPWRDSGAAALLIHTDAKAELVKLPESAASSLTQYTATVTPRPDGKAEIDAVVDLSGDDAADMRDDLVPESDADRRTGIQHWAGELLGGVALQDFKIEDLETIDKPLRITLRLQAPGLVSRAEDVTTVHGCALDCYTANPVPSAERAYPVSIDRPLQRSSVITLQAPAGTKAAPVPAPVRVDSIFGTYGMSCVADQAGAARCSRTLKLPRSRWPATTGPAFRKLFEQIVEADRMSVAFLPADAPATGAPAAGSQGQGR
jgi:hypothetical protein